jgi:thiosulfate reductase cytochrome b subunit
MIRFLLVSMTGWVAVLATGIEAALPYIIRDAMKGSAPQISAGGSLLRHPGLRAKMWPHYWAGYVLLAFVLAHASFVMGPAMGRSDPAGIWAATLALGLLFAQVGVGLVLKSGSNNQRQLRRWHFWSMIAVVGLIVTHLLRNG